jgi:hypothetical protein
MFLVNMMFYTAALNIGMNKYMYRQYPNTGFIGLDPDIGDTEFLLVCLKADPRFLFSAVPPELQR